MANNLDSNKLFGFDVESNRIRGNGFMDSGDHNDYDVSWFTLDQSKLDSDDMLM